MAASSSRVSRNFLPHCTQQSVTPALTTRSVKSLLILLSFGRHTLISSRSPRIGSGPTGALPIVTDDMGCTGCSGVSRHDLTTSPFAETTTVP